MTIVPGQVAGRYLRWRSGYEKAGLGQLCDRRSWSPGVYMTFTNVTICISHWTPDGSEFKPRAW